MLGLLFTFLALFLTISIMGIIIKVLFFWLKIKLTIALIILALIIIFALTASSFTLIPIFLL